VAPCFSNLTIDEHRPHTTGSSHTKFQIQAKSGDRPIACSIIVYSSPTMHSIIVQLGALATATAMLWNETRFLSLYVQSSIVDRT